MASTDAKPIPQKNAAHRITFPIFDADGDLVTGATALDCEVSKDGGTFADCTNEATEIATASGMYYLDLTATEMNADTVSIIVKTTSSGAKTTPIVLYPATGDINNLDAAITSRASATDYTAARAGYLDHLVDLKDEAFGKWVLDPAGKTLKLYRTGGTLFKTFDLTDTSSAVPNFIQRTPV